MAGLWCSKTHSDSVVSKFTQLPNDSQTDVTVKAGTQEFKAHKAVLAASSGYFMSLFTLEFREKSQSVVTIDYLPCESVMQLLHFCYAASLDLSDENILDIIQSACYLQMEHAIDLSFDYVKTTKRCDVPSHWKLVCEAASLAAAHGLSESCELCLDNIAYWFSAIYKTEMFVNRLTYEIFYKLLDRPELTKFRDFEKEMPFHKESIFTKESGQQYPVDKTTEDQVLEAVVGWLKHDWENRKCHAASLLGKVRLGTIDSANLDDLIGQEMRALDGCKDILRIVEEKKNEGDPSPIQPPLSVTMPEMFCPRGTVHTLIGLGSDKGVSCFYYNDPKNPVETKQWTILKYFPRPLERLLVFHSVIAVNRYLYVSLGGGDHQESFCKFDPNSAQWDSINFRHDTQHCALVYLDGWIYAFGSVYAGHETYARRYNIRDDKGEVLHPGCKYIAWNCAAVAYLGKVLVHSRRKPDTPGTHDTGESIFTLSLYDPVMNRWFKVFTQQHCADAPVVHFWYEIALVVHENKCYRVFFDYKGNRREGYVKPRVDELLLDVGGETPSCRLGESQEQFCFTGFRYSLNDDYDMRGKLYFCINGEMYILVNKYPLRTGHKMALNEDVDVLKKKWEHLYLSLSGQCAVTNYTFDLNRFD